MVLIESASHIRRGMIVSWEWGANASGQAALKKGLPPRGEILTQSDLPFMDRRFAIKVANTTEFLIDPVLAIEKGRKLFLVKAADPPQVLNAKQVGKSRAGADYIGRPSKWGNPFVLGKDGDRDAVIEKYIRWLHAEPDLVLKVRRELGGRDLICWCHPEQCHGHVLRDIAMGADIPEIDQALQADLFPSG